MGLFGLSNLNTLPHTVRSQLEALPQQLRDARADLAENPWKLWENPAARLIAWMSLGIAVFIGAGMLAGGLTATFVASDDVAQRALLPVVCMDPNCGHTFHAELPLDFDQWPIACAKCQQQRAVRSAPCEVCGGRRPIGDEAACPHCARTVERVRETEAAQSRPLTGDDAEDGW